MPARADAASGCDASVRFCGAHGRFGARCAPVLDARQIFFGELAQVLDIGGAFDPEGPRGLFQ